MVSEKFREMTIKPGNKILLGRDAKNNDKLMKQYQGKENVILHTVKPGSPFCVIEELNPSKEIVTISGSVCAGYSQDWRDHKSDVKIHKFTGKDIKKPFFSKLGTWKIKKKPKIITVKKKDIKKYIKKWQH